MYQSLPKERITFRSSKNMRHTVTITQHFEHAITSIDRQSPLDDRVSTTTCLEHGDTRGSCQQPPGTTCL